MALLFVSSLILSIIIISNAQIYHGFTTIIHQNSVELTINYDTNIVDIIMSGPINLWNGYGFGSTRMSRTYAIIIEYDQNNHFHAFMSEYTLANHRAGTRHLTPEATLLSDTENGQIRTVKVSRPIVGEYTFPNPPKSADIPFRIDLISAIGSSSSYSSHTFLNRATAPIILTQVATNNPTPIPTFKLISTNPTLSPSLVPTNIPTLVSTKEVIECNDMQSCTEQIIQCMQTNKLCFVQCVSIKSCSNAMIECNQNSDCIIEGRHDSSLSGASIIGPIGHELQIICDDIFSCQSIKINASQTSNVNIHCNGIKSCENLQIFCPEHDGGDHTKKCTIIGNVMDSNVDPFSMPTSMKIHAKNSWNDVNFTHFQPTMNGNNAENEMICAMDSCTIMIIDGIWSCVEMDSKCAQTTLSPSDDLCLDGSYFIAAVDTPDLSIEAEINCIENVVKMDIVYAAYQYNWFGIVFSKNMIGKAIVYTTGSKIMSDGINRLGLYAYDIESYNPLDIVYNADDNWKEIETVLEPNGLHLRCEQNLHYFTHSQWDSMTNGILFRYAIGNALNLEYHKMRSTDTFTLQFEAVTTTMSPSQYPSIQPSVSPTNVPTKYPTHKPSMFPTNYPTKGPSLNPTNKPSADPSFEPTQNPTKHPTARKISSMQPTDDPSFVPSKYPSVAPTKYVFTSSPSMTTMKPTQIPTNFPSVAPTQNIVYTTTKTMNNTLICDDVNLCAGLEITFDGNVECTTNLSCANTNFVCSANSNCMLYCIGKNSCQKTKILCKGNANCFIFGVGENSLAQMSFNGALHSNLLHISCNAINACNEALIAAAYTKQLTLLCNEESSCQNVKIQCPPYDISDNIARCKIETNAHFVVASKMYIFAVNSWMDLDILSHLSSDSVTTLNMFCGQDYGNQCVMNQNGNCKEMTSPCFVEPKVVSIDCNGFECFGKEFECPYHIGVVSECLFNCISSGSCDSVVFKCLDNTPCKVLCNSTNSCNGATIHCGKNDNCTIYGNGVNALANSLIIGGANGNSLNISCNSINGCFNATMLGQNVSNLNIHCNEYNACKDLTIYSPPSSDLKKHCFIYGDSSSKRRTEHDRFVIYAKNGWNDIEFVDYFPIILSADSKMYCNENESAFCQINNPFIDEEWNCNDKDYESECFINSAPLPPIATNDSFYGANMTEIICDDEDNKCEQDLHCLADDYDVGCSFVCNGALSCNLLNIYCSHSAQCIVSCNGDSSCSHTTIYGGKDSELHIIANGIAAMMDATIRADECMNSEIDCIGLQSCNNVKLFCPNANAMNEQQCVMNGGNNDIHQRLEFYAQRGFDDLDVSNYAGLILNSSVNGQNVNLNRMHCGNDYSSNCELNEDMFCECIYNDDDGNEEKEFSETRTLFGVNLSGDAAMAVIVVAAIIVIVMMFAVLYCVRCKGAAQNAYKSVENDHEQAQIGEDDDEYHDDDKVAIKSKWVEEDTKEEDEDQKKEVIADDEDAVGCYDADLDVDFDSDALLDLYKTPKPKNLLDDNEQMVVKSAKF